MTPPHYQEDYAITLNHHNNNNVNGERRKSARVFLPVKIHITDIESQLSLTGKRRNFLDIISDILGTKTRRRANFVEGELVDISSSGALIKINKEEFKKSPQDGLFFYGGNYLASSSIPLKVELKTPSGNHITTCGFYVKRLRFDASHIYLGGEFARSDGRTLLPLPSQLTTGDEKNAIVIAW